MQGDREGKEARRELLKDHITALGSVLLGASERSKNRRLRLEFAHRLLWPLVELLGWKWALTL